MGLMRIVTDAALPSPKALLALTTTGKSPLCVGVPTIWPVPLTDRPVGRPVAPYPVIVGLVATIWIGVMTLPTVPVTPGAAISGALTAGVEVGTIVNVSVKLLLVPKALLALNKVVTAPLAVGMPVIAPVLASSNRPAGSALGATTA